MAEGAPADAFGESAQVSLSLYIYIYNIDNPFVIHNSSARCIYTYIYIHIYGDLGCDFTDYDFRKTLGSSASMCCQRGEIHILLFESQGFFELAVGEIIVKSYKWSSTNTYKILEIL